ncbi:o-succinylbenzoate--CoA ligase [Luteipulveratus sp. YIM 133132]|uniref:o-succinylbenzoate--CoA ligase n=1 Tax=Luteipulveratus flavus TaxID=3031728 RepID=UPI0023AF26BC|nr:o-succinylbenzoate--CoA ligase [Luteipulveratus sp. YIM 133132]MDE9365028.1 o-succinylbenzoate--CoA ligase [Luteipulveratus sp. YIM 133132]
MPALVPFAVDPAALPAYLEALAQALAGSGPALLPYAAGSSEPQVPDDVDLPDELALVMSTSGSTGVPKRALLTRANLEASAHATHARLGGAGQWLLPMPAHHIAGTQVLVRSIVASTNAVLLNLENGFSTTDFADAVAWMLPARRYTSLVPTQLVRLLEDPAAVKALTTFDAVLLGGAASPPRLLARAAAAGVTVVPTYGMSETAGGCVYAGRPLDGTTVSIGADGRIGLAGPTVASGYLADPDRTAGAFDTDEDGRPRFWTDDVGELSADGLLHVLGRLDDLITTGGLKVAPRLVEEAALELPEISEAVAVGTADEEWGQVVSLAVVPAPGTVPGLTAVRDALGDRLPAYALPRRLLVLDALPLRGPGKPDRAALAISDGWQNRGIGTRDEG